jgi:hypothetical protein
MFGTAQRIGLGESPLTEDMYSSIETEEELEQLFNTAMNNARDKEEANLFRSHTTTHHSRWEAFGRVISLSQGSFPKKTQQSQQKNLDVLSGIQNHNISL